MRMLKVAAAALLAVALPCAALAQSSPGWTYRYVPTSAEWNNAFAKKQDTLGYLPLALTGGTMTGRLTTAPSTTTATGFNIPPGVAPTLPNNGDIWETSAGIFARINGATIGPLSSASSGSFAATGPLTVAFGAGVSTFSCPTCAVTTNPLSQFAATTSAQLRGVVSDETGGGLSVFNSAPTIISPVITTSFTATGLVGLGNLASQSANTVLAAATAGSPVAMAAPSCSGAANALQWLTGTGLQCGTITASASSITVGTTTVTGGPGLLYNSTSGAALAAAAAVNNGVLTFSGAGVPTASTTLPAATQANITGTGTLTGGATGAGFTVALGSSTITGVLGSSNGGSGVNNGAFTETRGGNWSSTSTVSFTGAFSTAAAFSQAGAFATTLTSTAPSNGTLPAGTHTLAAIDLAQTFTATQTLPSPVFTGTVSGAGTIPSGVLVSTGVTAAAYGSSTSIPSLTVNAQGQLTAAAGNAVIAPAGTLSGSTLASGVTGSSLTSVGALVSGSITTGFSTIGTAFGGTGATSLGATLNNTGLVLNCTTATTGQVGCGRPDGTTITVSGGVWTASGGSATAITVGTTGIVSGSSGQLLYVNGSMLGNQTIASALGSRATLPTIQKFTTGTSLTYTTPANVLWIEIEACGAGGGGGGSGSSGANTGGTGGTTSFSTLSLTGGTGGATAAAGGTGGAPTLGIGVGTGVSGGSGTGAGVENSTTFQTNIPGGGGGSSPLGGAGGGAVPGAAGQSAAANSCSGGGGGSTVNTGATTFQGSGGGSGGYAKVIVNSPTSTYTYTVGTLGTAGPAGPGGTAGGAGGAGYIIVTEHYGT